jgi:hypothetical protein
MSCRLIAEKTRIVAAKLPTCLRRFKALIAAPLILAGWILVLYRPLKTSPPAPFKNLMADYGI